MPSPFPTEPGTLRLLEPADASPQRLAERLLDRSYAKPFVLDNGHLRLLLFSLDFIQSAMRIDAPDALELAYTRRMACFLLFHTRIRELALIGLGGGSLAKFCYRHLPQAHVVAVESDANVIALREQFLLPADDERFAVVAADGAAWLAAGDGKLDVLLVDAYDVDATAPTIAAAGFYTDARRRLARDGLLVANLTGESGSRQRHLDLIRRYFSDNFLVVPVEQGYNHVVFAFRDAAFEPRWRWIDSQARGFGKRYGINFTRYLAALERCRKFGPGRLGAEHGELS